jgi:hypothetical protein
MIVSGFLFMNVLNFMIPFTVKLATESTIKEIDFQQNRVLFLAAT